MHGLLTLNNFLPLKIIIATNFKPSCVYQILPLLHTYPMRKLLNSISGIFYFTASIVHIWTVIVAFQESGFIAAIVSLFAPILSELYWMNRMWGTDSTYAQLALLHIILAILFWWYGIKKNQSR